MSKKTCPTVIILMILFGGVVLSDAKYEEDEADELCRKAFIIIDEDKDDQKRVQSILSLIDYYEWVGHEMYKKIPAKLLKALKTDKSESVRANCIYVLGELHITDAVPIIYKKLKEDQSWIVRRECANSIIAVKLVYPEKRIRSDPGVLNTKYTELPGGYDAVVSRLVDRMKNDEKVEVSDECVFALVSLNAKSAVPELMLLMKDDKRRERCVWALKKLTGQSFGDDAAKWQKWWKANKKRIMKEKAEKEKAEQELSLSFYEKDNDYKQGIVNLKFELANNAKEEVTLKMWFGKDGPSNISLYVKELNNKDAVFVRCEDPYNKSVVKSEELVLKAGQKIIINAQAVLNVEPGDYEIYGALYNNPEVKTEIKQIKVLKGKKYIRDLK